MSRFIIALSVLILLVLLGTFVFFPKDIVVENKASVNGAFNINDTDNNSPDEKHFTDRDILLYAVGDIMLDRGVEYMVYKHGSEDYRFPFLKIADELKKADIVFGNLESQISDKGHKIGTIYSFRAEPNAVKGLKYAGFNIVSVANNHSFDYDIPALEDSFKILKSAGIEYVGGGFNEEEAFSLKIMEVEDTKIGFLAYCDVGSKWWRPKGDNSGITFVTEKDVEEIKKKIKESKEKTDILIVSFHSGDEYETQPNSSQTYLYRTLIKAGADLIIGHHPHVIQPIEDYPPGYIAYSLGNFVFDQGFSVNTMRGSMLKVLIKDKEIKDVGFEEIKMNEYFQPELAPEEE